MNVSWKLLNQLVLMNESIERVADRMTVTGNEVEGIHAPSGKVKDVVVAKIMSLEVHPEKSGLQLAVLDLGDGKVANCATAAKNVYVGMVIPYGRPGATLADGTVLGVKEFGSFRSEGMMLSGQELGLPSLDMEDGILSLGEEAKIGDDVASWLELDDKVLEVSITANRGDMLSMFGTAREVYALFPDSQLNLPVIKSPEYDGDWTTAFNGITIDSTACPAYRLGMADEVRIGPSPMKEQVKLCMLGMRPISNIVDATNMAMLMLGQPLHAFDAASLPSPEITVRLAKDKEGIQTLDGKDRVLQGNDLVITSGGVPVAIAGVMGGANSEITGATKYIFVESAAFESSYVGRTSRRLGIPSEASYRFARMVDPNLTEASLNYVLELMRSWGAARPFARSFYAVGDESLLVPKEVALTSRKLFRITRNGDLEHAGRSLERLGMEKISGDRDRAVYRAPTRRQDIVIEEDLIEEVARLDGYDNIKPTIPVIHEAGKVGEATYTQGVLRSTAVGRGYVETVTYSFVSPELIESLKIPGGDRAKPLSNPISADMSVMRPSLLPGLVSSVKRGMRSDWNAPIRIFEYGKVFPWCEVFVPEYEYRNDAANDVKNGGIFEKNVIGGATFVGTEKRALYGDSSKDDFLSVKADVEALGLSRGVKLAFKQGLEPFGHIGQTAHVYAVAEDESGNFHEEKVGYLCRLKPSIALEFDIEQPVYVFEIDANVLIEGTPLRFSKTSMFPPVYRDVSLLARRDYPTSRVVEDIRSGGSSTLYDVKLFDIYEGKGIPEDMRSMAFSVTYRRNDRTLTDEEVEREHGALRSHLEKLGFKLR